MCVHCKDTIMGCEGGDLCPLVVEVAANAAAGDWTLTDDERVEVVGLLG